MRIGEEARVEKGKRRGRERKPEGETSHMYNTEMTKERNPKRVGPRLPSAVAHLVEYWIPCCSFYIGAVVFV